MQLFRTQTDALHNFVYVDYPTHSELIARMRYDNEAYEYARAQSELYYNIPIRLFKSVPIGVDSIPVIVFKNGEAI